MQVSILIPCYNAEKWVGQAIESALGQTWADKEVLVFDDGSTDGSLNVIKSFQDRIRWHSGEHGGANVARNWLLEQAGGEWLQYLDADDYLRPQKITNQLQTLTYTPNSDVLFGPLTMETATDEGVTYERSEMPEPHDPWVLLAGWSLGQTGSCLFRRKALQSVGGWNPKQACCQDYELYLRLLMAGKLFTYSPSDGAVYRRFASGSLSTRNVPEVYRQRLVIEDHLEAYLKERHELTENRLRAISDARFEIARLIRVYDADLASSVMEKLLKSEPDFTPRGLAAPLRYRIAYRIVGFSIAERLAEWKRRIFNGRG
jgi:glycosyltransferase involved in cell wall biosynthesis